MASFVTDSNHWVLWIAFMALLLALALEASCVHCPLFSFTIRKDGGINSKTALSSYAVVGDILAKWAHHIQSERLFFFPTTVEIPLYSFRSYHTNRWKVPYYFIQPDYVITFWLKLNLGLCMSMMPRAALSAMCRWGMRHRCQQRRRRHFRSGQATATKRSLMHVNGGSTTGK